MHSLKNIRLYINASLCMGDELELSPEHSHYLVNVMRLEQNDAIRLFNEKEGEYKAVLIKPHKKKTCVLIADKLREPKHSPELHLYLTPLKKQAQSYAIEKAVECGATHIHFIQTDYTDHTKVNIGRLQATAIEAAEQCRRFDIPKIFDVVTLDKVLTSWPDNQVLYLAAEDGRGVTFSKMTKSQAIPALMIGPEGGFSKDEFEKLASFPSTSFISLGDNILRAETAVVVGLSQINLT